MKEREGFDLLPEFGYKPVNKYLPPRARRDHAPPGIAQELPVSASTGSSVDRFFTWVDKTLSR